MKKNITPLSIIAFLGCLIYLVILLIYGSEYTRYFMYLFIPIIILAGIFNLIKQRKEDKLNGTKEFRASIYRMLFIVVILGAFFFITKQNYM